MRDRFKFRAWDVRNQKYLYHAENGIGTSDGATYIQFSLLDDVEGIVLEQSTGLHDVEDKLIYEGDIIEWYDEDKESNPIRGYVVMTKGAFKFISNLSEISINLGDCNNVKVVGNLNETPEIL